MTLHFGSLAEQIGNQCVHFTGIVRNESCKAGVNYDSVRREHAPIDRATISFPCNKRMNHCGVACEHQRFPTTDEIEAEIAEDCRRLEQLGAAMTAIREHSEGKRGVSGKLPCPACPDGQLSYSIANRNGHIHARCSTPSCIAFMQ